LVQGLFFNSPSLQVELLVLREVLPFKSLFSEIIGTNSAQKYYEKLRKRDAENSLARISLLVACSLINSAPTKICCSIFLLLAAIFADLGLKKI
jgi:hypothetical protein